MSTYYRQPGPGMPFADITSAVGLPDTFVFMDDTKPHSGRGAYVGDLDRDGRLDVLVGAFNEPFRLYQNATKEDAGMHFLRVRLIGTVSAADPVGAVIEADLDDGTRVIRQHMAGGCTFGSGDLAEDIGIGARMPAKVSVRWPSGLVERVDGLPGFAVDREVAVREPEWLTLSARTASAAAPAPVLTYRPSEVAGTTMTGTVAVVRSDGVAVRVRANGDGTFAASLPHPGVVRRTRIAISVGGVEATTHPVIDYR
jgi:hypothetical protein